VKRNFLVVAASDGVRETLARELRAKGCTVAQAASGAEARRIVASVSIDMVLIDTEIKDTPPDVLRRQLQKRRPDCRVVSTTCFGHVRNSPEQLRFGSDDYLLQGKQLAALASAPFEGARTSESDCDLRQYEALVQVIDVLVGLLEIDDAFFGGSSHRAAALAREVAEELAADSGTVQAVVLATLLRDVGKVGVESDVFAYEGSLSERQKERMRDHVSASLRLFEHVDFPWFVMPIIRHHHESYDGDGYPSGLRGREIPLGARIVAVVDAFVSLTSDRPYRVAVESEMALQKIVRQAGRQFDPEVVEAFQKVLDKRLESRGAQHKPRVLIADPDKEFRRVLKANLTREGLHVRFTDGCAGAMKLLAKNPPDLILLDADGGNGEALEFLEQLRKDPSHSRIPLALLSSSGDRVLKLKALPHGVDDFLHKSDDLLELVARVQNVLTRETLRREGGAKRTRRGITGELENLSLPDIIQTLVMGMKSARVTVSSADQHGKIWFENGAVVHAEAGALKSDEAFFEMVSWTSGEFVIEHGLTTSDKTMDKDTMFLLMEGLRLLDERTPAAS